MLKIIPGKKGSGKTKELLESLDKAKKTGNGHVIAVRYGNEEFNEILNHEVRVINSEEYKLRTSDDFYGFVAGIIASDYDITDIFFDGFLRLIKISVTDSIGVLARIDSLVKDITIYFTISEDADALPEELKKYL